MREVAACTVSYGVSIVLFIISGKTKVMQQSECFPIDDA